MTQASDITRRTRMTRPYPSYTLEDALSVARAIYDENAGLPFDRELLAGALGTTPKSSAFTMRLNASAAYGLTEGGYNDPDIRLTDLGKAAFDSDREVERRQVIVKAAMNPDTFASFYGLFDGKRLPQKTYLHNILQRELDVHADLVEECLGIIQVNGEFAGIISEADGDFVVRLPDAKEARRRDTLAPGRIGSERQVPYEVANGFEPAAPMEQTPSDAAEPPAANSIFIGHIGESAAATYVASMLDDFGIACNSPLISDDDDAGGLLVSKDVSKAMRAAAAAVLVFRSGDNAWSSRDKMIGMLGAASVLFDDRIVVVHEDGAGLSISLDGLNHIEFDRERPGESGMALLVALHRAGVVSISA